MTRLQLANPAELGDKVPVQTRGTLSATFSGVRLIAADRLRFRDQGRYARIAALLRTSVTSMKKKTPRTDLRRRDATGHLDPRYAAELLEQGRENQTSDPPPSGFVENTSDDFAEDLAEEFVRAATSAEDGDNDTGDELITGELDVPEGDDDDLAFETQELKLRRAPSTRTEPKPARARKAGKRKAKRPRAAKVKAKAKTAKSKTSKVKAVTARATKLKPPRKKSKRTRKT